MDQTKTATAKKLDWDDDHLGRKADAANILHMIDNRAKRMKDRDEEGAVVLNLDASWGEGKTFLLQRMQTQLEDSCRLVASVNAWELDYDDDPFPALIGPIAQALEQAASKRQAVIQADKARSVGHKLAKVAGKVAIASAKGAALQLLKKLLGSGAIEELGELTKEAINAAGDATIKTVEDIGNSYLTDGQERRDAVFALKAEIKNQLAAIPAAENSSPIKLIVLVDELDRCRPNYAISMLERIKHLFDIEGVAFVVATDTKQLCASIKGVYGSEFDAQTYLRRFFPLSYRLQSQSLKQLVANALSTLPKDKGQLFGTYPERAAEIVAGIFAAFQCSTRDALQHLAHADMALDGFERNRVFYPLLLVECICQQRVKMTAREISRTGEAPLKAKLKLGVAGFSYISNNVNLRAPYNMDAANYIVKLIGISATPRQQLIGVETGSDFEDSIYNNSRDMLFGNEHRYGHDDRRDLEGIVAACGQVSNKPSK